MPCGAVFYGGWLVWALDVRCRMLVALVLAAYSAGPDMGPTYGADYAGQDYNVTSWNTPKSKSADNYKASALACEAYCDADPKCCAWTCESPTSNCVALPMLWMGNPSHWLHSRHSDLPCRRAVAAHRRLSA